MTTKAKAGTQGKRLYGLVYLAAFMALGQHIDRDPRKPRGLADARRRERFHLQPCDLSVHPHRTVYRSHDHASRDLFVAWAKAVDGVANPASVVVWSTDKVYLTELAGQRIPVVPTTWLDPGRDAELPNRGRWVLKPQSASPASTRASTTPDDQTKGAHLRTHARPSARCRTSGHASARPSGDQAGRRDIADLHRGSTLPRGLPLLAATPGRSADAPRARPQTQCGPLAESWREGKR